ncbi:MULTISPECIES: cytochrome aa3 quinol oxidase subunit III [Rossellomorea]|uniref:Quinol oxidase subunit 3 n=1 Tax=Rossellomorea vietnamensis TaxID=218284 RepID=A0A6I6USX9_9BACI|nr:MULTISPECIES: cytochrome aa3 quinol oxidase subunit III [Rossellomorea]MCA0150662.1 cytochrome aa3 quinol oxidase subunit III [Rossellomorea vietnamensis]MCC5802043.1 cytochrome aa3 quinol oxidase subunit III [Rossellomorea vietnamensis]QHE63069.1 cytochrome aa3 quinol oxidase subunit III [Rossellomorea vietnamensis]UTE77195.1 cytochrome aa3 quinol oxidase subunit III [Rossellomorea sp. KS-H15a]
MAHSTNIDPNTPLEYQSDIGKLNIFGFWVFLGAEIALFATIFATFFALKAGTMGGPLPSEVFDMKNTIIMTLLLLISSFTSGLSINELRKRNVKSMMVWLIITLLFGLGFLYMEITEFIHLVHEGAAMGTNAFWSSFYLLTGTHGLHVSVGILWILLVMFQVKKRGLNPDTAKKLFVSSLYWHFLDFVWIFVFTSVYLLGMVG